jgi:hypothetical protein
MSGKVVLVWGLAAPNGRWYGWGSAARAVLGCKDPSSAAGRVRPAGVQASQLEHCSVMSALPGGPMTPRNPAAWLAGGGGADAPGA